MATVSSDLPEHFSNKNTAKETICGTEFSKEFVVEKLAETHPTFREKLHSSKIREVTAKDICGAKGFCSKIYRIVAIFENSNETLEQKISVVMKVFTTDNLSEWNADEIMMDKVRQLHNIECAAYNYLGNVPKDVLPLPEVYYTQESDIAASNPGIIIMEDLTEKACMVPLSKGLSVDQVKNVVGHLAKFHHYLLCGADQSWRDCFGKSVLEGAFKDCAEVAVIGAAVNCNREVFEEPLKRLRKAVDPMWSGFYCHKEGTAEDLPELLVHGDLWLNNLMWKRKSDGKHSDDIASIIDWQNLYKGKMTLDIARLVVICCDADVRHALEACIVEHYYEALSRMMQSSGKVMGYSLEQLKKAYQYSSLAMTVVMCNESPFYKLSVEGEDTVDESTEDKLERFWKRVRSVLDDTIQTLELIAPEWLA
ncbi:ecdysteroid kinase domain-containing protein [Ditylenchus destructor]|uniref:Ecdysteroid kinase domain-containing protein n=1 Tax=Ditylenchus destructor TaxID=166010 RepID=A0AAD4MSJ9_9BILA|nr:ecdysteroid kinase domain-containing protein [Ditylenchus destructor]